MRRDRRDFRVSEQDVVGQIQVPRPRLKTERESLSRGLHGPGLRKNDELQLREPTDLTQGIDEQRDALFPMLPCTRPFNIE